ncbi:MAG: aa3-type cytochrome c oxidase subunit IV [Phyllobacterium sp.]
MAEHHNTGPAELGAAMDYAEHEKTYDLFIGLSKWSTVVCVALLIAMAFGFFTTAGFVSSTILFFIVMAVAWFVL